MNVRFLIDEDLSLDYVRELQRYNAQIDALRVGSPVRLISAPSIPTSCSIAGESGVR